MARNKKITIEGTEIAILSQDTDDYISLTDMAKSQLQKVVIIKWLSLKNTIGHLGEWESLYNPGAYITSKCATRITQLGSSSILVKHIK